MELGHVFSRFRMLPHRWRGLLGPLVNLGVLGDLADRLSHLHSLLLLALLVIDDIGILAGPHLVYLLLDEFKAAALASKE